MSVRADDGGLCNREFLRFRGGAELKDGGLRHCYDFTWVWGVAEAPLLASAGDAMHRWASRDEDSDDCHFRSVVLPLLLLFGKARLLVHLRH